MLTASVLLPHEPPSDEPQPPDGIVSMTNGWNVRAQTRLTIWRSSRKSGACDGEDGHDDGTHFDVDVVGG